MKEIDKLALIDLRNGKILCARSKGKEKYYLPGGKREKGESDERALRREIDEELNVIIDANSLDYVGTFTAQADGHAEGIMVKMTCYKAHYQGEPVASSEIDEIKWLNYKDIDLVAAVDKIIFNFLKDRGELK